MDGSSLVPSFAATVFLYSHPPAAPHTSAKKGQSSLLHILISAPRSLQTVYQVVLVVVSPGRLRRVSLPFESLLVLSGITQLLVRVPVVSSCHPLGLIHESGMQ